MTDTAEPRWERLRPFQSDKTADDHRHRASAHCALAMDALHQSAESLKPVNAAGPAAFIGTRAKDARLCPVSQQQRAVAEVSARLRKEILVFGRAL